MSEELPPLEDWNACEWNPEEKRESYRGENHALATVLVGSNGNYRLCANCATLPEFKKFRKRQAIVWRKQAT